MLPPTTSPIGPATAPRAETPLRSSATMCGVSQPATLASSAEVSEGAYQFCTGISPPARSSVLEVAPSALRLAWQALQWPRPSTRYAPRFHSGLRVVSGTGRAGRK